MNYLVEKTFEHRGITWDDYVAYENSSHGFLKDVDILCAELHKIQAEGRHIVILSDFDMDGIASGVCGFAGLSELGFHVSLYIPNVSNGYGFTEDDIDKIRAQYPDVYAIITCDVGISCYDAIDYANYIGIHMLVTDHHMQKELKNHADVIVNPMRLDETYAHPSICGAYVMFQVLERYVQIYHSGTTLPLQIARLAVFAGIGTISDSMPLLYENRKLVRDAVSILKLCWEENLLSHMTGCSVYRAAFQGLRNVLLLFFNMGKLESLDDIDEEFFGYYFAPMFNSAKRMNGDMSRVFGIFFGNQSYADAEYLYELNRQRKIEVADAFEVMLASDQPFAPFIYFSDARAGILGLLAQDVMKQTGMPALVVALDKTKGSYHGSGRSPVWYPFLNQTEGIIYAEGHNPAFGVGFSNYAAILVAFAFLKQDVYDIYNTLPADAFAPNYDFTISTNGTGDIGIDIMEFRLYLDDIVNYKPFGKGFPAPNILFEYDAHFIESAKRMGKAGEHLKLVFFDGFSVLLFYQGELCDKAKEPGVHKVSGHLALNEFRGQSSVDFIGDFLE